MSQTERHPAPGIGVADLWQAARNPPQDPTTSYIGKTIVITGANSGLGYEAAFKFATLGASRLIFGVRSIDRGNAAKKRIEQSTKCGPSVIQLVQLDMADFNSVESFVRELGTRFNQIDVVLLNAGVGEPAYKLSPHGWEMTIQVNVLSTIYLALLLLPKLRGMAQITRRPCVVECVGSLGHTDVKLEEVKATKGGGIITKVNSQENFSFLRQYQISKLLVLWGMRQIAANISPQEVIVVSSCPGLCRSSLGRDFAFALRILDALNKRVLGKSAEEGSRTLVSAAALDERAHGGFWTDDKLVECGQLATTEEGNTLSDQFWEETLSILRKQNKELDDVFEK